MADDASTTNNRCPMCGAGLSADADCCRECGEQLGGKPAPEPDGVKTYLERIYEKNLSALEALLIAVGHLTWMVAVGVIVIGMPAFGLIVLAVASVWIVAGYACAYHRKWGILTGVTVSYLALGGSLLYWNLFGITVSLILSLQAHRVLRLSHRVDAARLSAQEEF